jgi:hypothetical protein
MDVEEISVRESDTGVIYVSVNMRAKAFIQFQHFEGCGETLSEAFADLSDQLADAGV